MKPTRIAKRGRAVRGIGTLAVLGVGLIGGSFARALKKQHAVEHVIGADRDRANLKEARRLGVIDEIADVAVAVKAADFVLLAVPPGQIGAVLEQVAPHLGARAVVSDVGSIKRASITEARRHLGSAFPRFVPAHPIAGTEKSGAKAALTDLFVGRYLVVTPEPETNASALRRVTAAWKLAGARIVTMTPDYHDRALALVSHLPHLAAYALMGQVAGYKDAATLLKHTGGGFRDMTRIASSSPAMWRDICLANRDVLLPAIDDYIAELVRLRSMIEASDGKKLQARMAMAQSAREKWLLKKSSSAKRIPKKRKSLGANTLG